MKDDVGASELPCRQLQLIAHALVPLVSSPVCRIASITKTVSIRSATDPAIMAKDEKTILEEVDGVERLRKEARPDFSVPPPRKQLPKDIQDKLNDEGVWDSISDGRYEP